MITLTVTSYKGAAAAGNLSVGFDELGGTIGRADTNQMVLPDPERAISRTHAQVVFRSGTYALIGTGANPVVHNGNTLEHGGEVTLSEGDQIDIGSYRIAVSTRQTAKKVDPFDAAFADSSSFAQTDGRAKPALSEPDPITTTPKAQPAAVAARKGAEFGIPEDWDPFEQDRKPDPFGGSPRAAGGASAPGEGSASLAGISQSSRENSLDDLFGLQSGKRSADPFGAAPPASSVAQPGGMGGGDPMRSLLEPSKPAPRAEPDHVSDLQAPWTNPARAPVAPPAEPAVAPPGAVFSWESASRDGRVVGQPERKAKPVDPAAEAVATRILSRSASQDLAAAAAPATQPPPSAAGTGVSASERELLQALRDGLGAPDVRLDVLTPELMRHLGQLLREATRGTIDLLAARAALKRELRANITMIIASENNSLKFSPSVDVALQYMLGPKMSGFMPPVQSMRDAYDDLRAHQLGVMAGMKAALAGVLKRFDPAVVESRLATGSALSNLLPSSRKAKLWEQFQELYQQLASDAEEDFNTIYGAAFVRAYQEYIDQLDDAAPKG